MPLPLTGRTLALAETRQLEELVTLCEREGATVLRIPLIAILDTLDPESVRIWTDHLIAGDFDRLAFMTGEGIRRILAQAERDQRREAVIQALGAVPSFTRGPKPGQAFKEVGLKPTRMADSPTTAGLVATLLREELRGSRIGVQLHGSEPNLPLTQPLEDAGAIVKTVNPYRYAPSADEERVAELIERMAAGTIDLLVITSTPQVERIVEVAKNRGLNDTLRIGLARTEVASVGPIASESLVAHGMRVDVMPAQGWQMKNLVVHVKRKFGSMEP
jgi:uroporphyrinogen-III synthase